MANNKNFIAKNGVSTGDGYAMPDVRSNLLFDFRNSQTLDPRISFSRGTVGHYYDGKTTTKAEENITKYSQEFDNAFWTKANVVATANDTTAPDGTTTADKVIENTAAGVNRFVRMTQTVPSGTYTYSIYAKIASGSRYCGLRVLGIGDGKAWASYDLTSGTVNTQTGTDITGATITDVGNSWYRLTMTATHTVDTEGLLFGFSTDGSEIPDYTGDGTSGFYIWGAQLEQRSSATAYTATTSAYVVNYQPTLVQAAINNPRFNYFPVTGQPRGLLLEDGRTNYARYSESFGTGTWSYFSNISVEDNVAVAPNGTLTADLLIANTTNGTHYLGIPSSFSSGTTVECFSVYAKAYGVNKLRFALANQTGNYSQVFNLDTGTLGTSGADNYQQAIEDCGNGWYRCSWTFLSTKTNPYPTISLADDNGNTTFAGDGFHGVLLWGGQWERCGGDGYFPTSYIQALSNSEVSRSADNAQVPVDYSAEYAVPESTTYIEADSFGPLNVGTYRESTVTHYFNSSNWWDLGPNSWGSGSSINTYQYWNGSGQIVVSKTLPNAGDADVNGTNYKAAAVYANNDYAMTCAGSTSPTTDAVFNLIPINQTILYLGSRYGSQRVNGHFKKFAYYPARLSNETLAQMTED